MRFFFSKPKAGPADTYMEPAAKGIYTIVHSMSETGPVRKHNEDHILIHFLDNRRTKLLCAVADGMGGHEAGEVASGIACSSILQYVTNAKDEISTETLEQALQQAHRHILKDGAAHPERKGMGTTATVAFINNDTLAFAHIGDSRLYHYSNGNLTQLSKDHTLVNDMYERGEITKEEQSRHAMRNVLTQALGTTQVIRPQQACINVSLQDKLLLCSDGLYDVFSEEELKDLMRMSNNAFILECMKTLANERRASDNFSAILLSFSDDFLPVAPITKEQTIPS